MLRRFCRLTVCTMVSTISPKPSPSLPQFWRDIFELRARSPQRISAAVLPKFSGLVDDLAAPIEYTLADAIGAAQLYQVPHLQDFNVAGPFTVSGVSDTPSRRKVFKCRPVTANEEVPCATNI